MEKNYLVYAILLDGVVKYIGVTGDFTDRKRRHLYIGDKRSAIPKGTDSNKISFEIIEKCKNRDSAYESEGKYILEYNTIVPNGWNKRRSGFTKNTSLEYKKKYREENHERIYEYMKEYSKEHKEEIKKAKDKYVQKNKDEIRIKAANRAKERRKNDPEWREHQNELQRQRWALNREKRCKYLKEWRAKKKQELLNAIDQNI